MHIYICKKNEIMFTAMTHYKINLIYTIEIQLEE